MLAGGAFLRAPVSFYCSCGDPTVVAVGDMQDKGIDEAFWPIFELDEVPEAGKGSHWTVRIGMAAALVAAVWALHAYAPDKGAPLASASHHF